MIRIVLFASVREAVGESTAEIETQNIRCVGDVMHALCSKGSRWREALARENLLVAVNQEMVEPDAPVADGDEVAFFPPVTGG